MNPLVGELRYLFDQDGEQLRDANRVGYGRHKGSIDRGYDSGGPRLLYKDVIGSRGELAVDNILSFPWRKSVNEPGSPDFRVWHDGGKRWINCEIRTAPHYDYHGKPSSLIIHPSKDFPRRQGWIFVFVRCVDFARDFRKSGFLYEVAGWIHGDDVLRHPDLDQWVRNPGTGREPGVFVPITALDDFLPGIGCRTYHPDYPVNWLFPFECDIMQVNLTGKPRTREREWWNPDDAVDKATKDHAEQSIETMRSHLPREM